MLKKTMYLDCYSGISGDMFIGALLDAGLSLSLLSEQLSSLPLSGYKLEAEKVSRYGISGTDFRVLTEKNAQFRNIESIGEIISGSGLPPSVKNRCMAVFQKLAEAEAHVHSVTVEQVHFHEIGALDSIVDIVGSVTALHLMGIDEIICSPLPLGRGLIKIQHGKVPLPAPATAKLLADSKVSVYGVETKGELVTPTGAALVATLAEFFGEIPRINMESIGYGAGKKDFGIPNYLRVMVGSVSENRAFYREKVDIIEANIDDLNPEITGYVMEKLFEEGALDVYFTPVQMKKNRPAVKLTVLSPPGKADLFTDIIFRETSTLGCRVAEAQKVMLPRHIEKVETPWGTVRVKTVKCHKSGEFLSCSPEYEDCLAVARRQGIPLREVYRTVERLCDTGDGSEL